MGRGETYLAVDGGGGGGGGSDSWSTERSEGCRWRKTASNHSPGFTEKYGALKKNETKKFRGRRTTKQKEQNKTVRKEEARTSSFKEKKLEKKE